MQKKILISILIFINFSLQSHNWWNSKKIKGNGNVITKARTLTDFDGITLEGAFNIVLVNGNENKITIEGEENIIPYIITEVKNSVLRVYLQKNTNINTTKKLTISIPFKEIKSVSLNGSGSIASEKQIKTNTFSLNLNGSGNINLNLESSSVETSISGSGNIKLTGITNNLKCFTTGSGNLNAYDLKTEQLKVTITGSGNLKVNVKNKIEADIIGSGNIYYTGNTKHIDSNIIGSGSLIKK